MRKMMLLAAMVALATLMMVAAPAMAQDLNGDGFVEEFCEDLDGDGIEEFCEKFLEDFCEDFDGDEFCDEDEEEFFFGDGITQDFNQEAESGDIDQSFDVSQMGDNSNQTVGIQGVANTGNAQNQIGVVDTGGFANFDDNDFFNNEDDFCEDFDGNEFCEDLEEFCEDFDGDGFCDFFFGDDNRFFDDDERFFFNGDNDGDIDFEDVGSTIEVSPTNTVDSSQQVNQAAAASAPHHWVWTAHGWMWV